MKIKQPKKTAKKKQNNLTCCGRQAYIGSHSIRDVVQCKSNTKKKKRCRKRTEHKPKC